MPETAVHASIHFVASMLISTIIEEASDYIYLIKVHCSLYAIVFHIVINAPRYKPFLLAVISHKFLIALAIAVCSLLLVPNKNVHKCARGSKMKDVLGAGVNENQRVLYICSL